MEYCPTCNIEYPVGTRYCKRCKTVLSFVASTPENVSYIKCPYCGQTTPSDKGICESCHQGLPRDTQTDLHRTPILDSKSKKKKKNKPFRDVTQIPIETVPCPKCGKEILKDFETCPHCGSPLHTPPIKQVEQEPANAPEIPVLTQDVTPQPPETTETLEILPVEEEIKWETMECPSCHKVTRVDTGQCRHCNALLTPGEEKPMEKVAPTLTSQKSTDETQNDLPIQIPKPKAQQPPPSTVSKIMEPIIVVKSQKEEKIKTSPEPPKIAKSSKPAFFLIIGVIAIILIVLIINLQKLTTSSTNSSLSQNPVSAASIPVPTPIITDSDLIMGVLNSVRDAMLSQNTTQYLAAYSPQFPDLNLKEKGLQDLWNTYHILDLKYDVSDEIPLTIKEDKAEILIHWSMSLKSIKDNKTVSAPETDLVKFEKLNGQWKITDVSVR